MDCHIKTKKEKILRRKIAKSSLKNRLFKFRSHPHGDFGIWHLLYSHYKKWVQKIPEALGVILLTEYHASSIRLWRVILRTIAFVRSDIQLTPSDICYASYRRIEYH